LYLVVRCFAVLFVGTNQAIGRHAKAASEMTETASGGA